MAADLSNPYVQRELAAEQVRIADHKRDCETYRGVRYAGYGEPMPFRARSLVEIVADAKAREDRVEAFKTSSRGRFLAALKELEALGWAAEAERARAAYRRGFADDERAPNPREIGVALASINDIGGTDARDARDCLAELLIQTRRAA